MRWTGVFRDIQWASLITMTVPCEFFLAKRGADVHFVCIMSVASRVLY